MQTFSIVAKNGDFLNVSRSSLVVVQKLMAYLRKLCTFPKGIKFS